MPENETNMVCKHCGNEWDGNCISYVSIEVWTAFLEAQKCPKCGANYQLTSMWDKKRWRKEWLAEPDLRLGVE